MPLPHGPTLGSLIGGKNDLKLLSAERVGACGHGGAEGAVGGLPWAAAASSSSTLQPGFIRPLTGVAIPVSVLMFRR